MKSTSIILLIMSTFSQISGNSSEADYKLLWNNIDNWEIITLKAYEQITSLLLDNPKTLERAKNFQLPQQYESKLRGTRSGQGKEILQNLEKLLRVGGSHSIERYKEELMSIVGVLDTTDGGKLSKDQMLELTKKLLKFLNTWSTKVLNERGGHIYNINHIYTQSLKGSAPYLLSMLLEKQNIFFQAGLVPFFYRPLLYIYSSDRDNLSLTYADIQLFIRNLYFVVGEGEIMDKHLEEIFRAADEDNNGLLEGYEELYVLAVEVVKGYIGLYT